MIDSFDTININNLKLAAGSYSNQTYTYVDNEKNYYIFLNKYYTPEKIKRQLTMLKLLSNNNIPVPEVVKNGTKLFINKDIEIIITEEIKGMNLGLLITEDKEMAGAAFYLMGKMLKKIHSIGIYKNFGYIENDIYCNWKEFLEESINYWLNFCFTHNRLFSTIKIKKIQEYLCDLIKQLPDEESSSVLHGDYYPNNVIYDEVQKRISGVVDFEWSMYGDPIYDFRVMEFFLFPNYSVKDRKRFYEGYSININEIEHKLSIYKEIYKLEMAYMISLTDKNRLKEAEDFLNNLFSQAKDN